MSTAIENTFVAPAFSADENFTALQPKYDYDLTNQKKGGIERFYIRRKRTNYLFGFFLFWNSQCVFSLYKQYIYIFG